MGSDYQPKIIIGLRLTHDKLYETRPHYYNHCKCKPQIDPANFPNARYCSICGSPIRRPGTKTYPIFPEVGGGAFYDHKVKIKGWPVEQATDGEEYYIGYYSECGPYGHSGARKASLPDMSRHDAFVKDMKELGFWDPEEFGAWIVLYHSY